MIFKIIETIVFLLVIILEKMYVSMGWWDSVSLIIVLGGSILVWLFYKLRGRKWDFVARYISVFLGIAYSIIWSIILMLNYSASVIFPLAVIPAGYGFVLGILSELIYRRLSNAEETD